MNTITQEAVAGRTDEWSQYEGCSEHEPVDKCMYQETGGGVESVEGTVD